MVRFYSRLFVRIISKNTDVYVLKVFTLAIAFAASIIVILFSIQEFGYDTNHKNSDKVFRMLAHTTDKNYDGNRLSASIPNGVFNGVTEKFGDSVIISRVKTLNKLTVIDQRNQAIYDQRVYAADSMIDDIFTFDITAGDIRNFSNPHDVVAMLSMRSASLYFGSIDIVGKTIRLTTFGDTLNVAIVAVFADFPSNTHEDFNFFITYDSSALAAMSFDSGQSGIYGRFMSEKISSPTELSTGQSEFLFQPIQDIYFGPRVLYEEARHGDTYSMGTLICIVALILLLAIFSFVNLSTITLPYRSKEIAVKKLAGSTQMQLLFQFTYESFALTSAALVLGVLILLSTAHYLNSTLGIDIIGMLTNTNLVFLVALVLMVLVVVISPVLMVIRFIRSTPARLLSTDTITFPRFKRIVTVVQFGVSIFLIVSSILVGRQINYSLIKEPGQNHDQVIYVACPPNIPDSAIYRIKGGWPNKNPKVLDAIVVSQLPNQITSKDIRTGLFVLETDYNFKDFFQFSMVEGDWFEYTDTDSVLVVNRMALKRMSKVDPNVIGVIQDLGAPFNQPEQPVKIRNTLNTTHNWICVRVDEVDIRNTLKWVVKRMREKRSYGNVYFMNRQFELWLNYQDQLNALSRILTVISILLAGCAIYGLTVSLVRDRLNAIAVHHLFGAGITDITRLLASDLLKQLIIAVAIFGPVTYILLNELLRTFVYATRFTWWDPVLPIGYCLVVIIALCGFQSFGLSRRDLVKSIKGR